MMSGVRFDVLWSPTQENQFIKYGTTIDLFQVEKLPNKSDSKATHANISDETVAIHLATNSEIHLLKCVAWCTQLEPKNLLAVGQTNGKVVLTSFGNPGGEDLIGKEFMYSVKHVRQCSYLAWNPVETHLLAEGFSEKYRSDPCVAIWDVTAAAGSDMLSSYERSRVSTNSEWGTVTKPAYEIGPGDTSSSFCWYTSESKTFVTGINNRQLRVYDLRDLSRPHLTSQHRSVFGICVDPLFDRRLASFGENQVTVWDTRNFEKPILTLSEAKAAVIKISWCPTRLGMLSVLYKDTSAVKMFDIRHSNIGSDEIEPALIERNIQSCRHSTLSSFCWHPTHENRLLSVASSGEVRDVTVFDRMPMMWSPSFHLTWACGRKIIDCFQENSSQPDSDISVRMQQRVKNGYGMHMNDLLENLIAVQNEPHIHGLWRWLAAVRQLSACMRETQVKNPISHGIGVRGLLDLLNTDTEVPKSNMTYVPWQGLEGVTNNHQYMHQFRSIERTQVLQLCGWEGDIDSPASVNSMLQRLQVTGHHSKAAALALFTLRMKQSLDILSASSMDILGTSGASNLNAVAMAIAGYTEEKKTLWQKTCSTLRLHLEDPYLRAMFAFLAGDRETYKEVLQEKGMAVEDRVAFACIYLRDQKLSDFINELTTEMKMSGNLDGLLLTGATPDGLELLEKYVDNTSDVQTAALAVMYTLPNELCKDRRIKIWIENYRSMLDRWRLWHHRARFDIINQLNDTTLRVPAQVFVNCNFCGKSITSTSTMIARSRSYFTPAVGRAVSYKPKITCCPGCRKSLPRCALCLTNLGTASGTGIGQQKNKPDGSSLDGKLSLFKDWFTWCQSCRHGGHASHITQWFREHAECPVTGCSCKCMTIDSIGRVMGDSAVNKSTVT